MIRPTSLVQTIAVGLTTDTYSFQYGLKPDQNFNADNIDFATKNAAVFLDYPIKAKLKYTAKNNLKIYNVPLSVFFCYKIAMDDTQAFKDVKIQKAWDAAREFLIQLNKTKDLVEITDEDLIDVDNVFDINLCGCLLTLNYTMRDTKNNCA